jgi:hypothetical protein
LEVGSVNVLLDVVKEPFDEFYGGDEEGSEGD